MGVDGTSPTAAGLQRAIEASSIIPNRQECTFFWLGLTCAAALHAILIFGVASSLPRHMGERDGSLDGITVDLVDEADVFSKTTVPTRTEASPPRSGKAAKPDSPTADTAKPSPHSHDEQKEVARSIEKDAQGLLSLPDPSKKRSESSAAKKDQPKPRQPLDLSARLATPDIPFSGGGLSASMARPPGVTRSGENDDFGRGVIRALRQTMPGLRDTVGRVTVRLFLSQNGNLEDVQLVNSAGNANLDQSVVFAVKQASFPIPPARSTPIDRTFLVTYIYQ
ncbi:MAG: cell envelope integrity protein TolA [Hyphomicrobiaceae bacterium]